MFVYAIEGGDYVKIGIAADVTKRLAQLAIGNPYEMAVLATWPMSRRAARIVESYAHQFLKDHRITGEWFAADATTCIRAISDAIEISRSYVDIGYPATPRPDDPFPPPWPARAPFQLMRHLIAPYRAAYEAYMAGDRDAKRRFLLEHHGRVLRLV